MWKAGGGVGFPAGRSRRIVRCHPRTALVVLSGKAPDDRETSMTDF
jgi:hypothetical protein